MDHLGIDRATSSFLFAGLPPKGVAAGREEHPTRYQRGRGRRAA